MTRWMPGRRTSIAASLLLAGAAAACGSYRARTQGGYPYKYTSGSGSGSFRKGPTSVVTLKAKGTEAHGTHLTDGNGRSLYLFSGDSAGRSACDGACAKKWPPLTGSAATADSSVNQDLVGMLQRSDGGHQVTYAGHPLYYSTADRSPGTTDGQGVTAFGGKWQLVGPDGKPVALASPPPAGATSP